MIGKVTRNANFHRIAMYIFSQPGASKLIENVPEGRTIDQKAAAMQLVASRNHRVKRPAYHLSLSPAEGDRLSRGDWALFCNQVLQELGFWGNQVLIGLHHDVKYPGSDQTRTHAHLLINLVDDSGKCFDTRWDYYKIPKVLRHLERCYGLQSVPDVGEVGKQRDSSGQYRLQKRSETSNSGEVQPVHRSVRCQLQDMIDEILKRCSCFEELAHALQSRGVEVNLTPQGWWVQYEGFAFAGYQLGRAYTTPSVLKRLEVEQMADHKEESQNSNMEKEPVSSMQEVFASISDSQRQEQQSQLESSVQPETVEANTFQKPQINPESHSQESSPTTESNQSRSEKVSEKPEINPESSQPTESDRVEVEPSQVPPSQSEQISEEPELQRVTPVVKDSSPTKILNTETQSQSESESNTNSVDWIDQLKQQAHQLEQTELIDGKFYTGLALDVTAHLAEISRDIVESVQEVQQPESSTAPNPEAVAEALSQFVQTRAEVHELNPDEPIATNLGTLHLNPHEQTISITRNITVAQWDEESQEWQINSELAEQHQNPVTQLLNNEAVEVEGYRLVGDESQRAIAFEEVRFQATQTDDGWQIGENHLSEDEQNRILKLPQSSEDYSRTANGKDLVNYLQRHTPKKFEQDMGVINWTAENGAFDRRFEVSVQPDESVLIEGFDLKRTDDFGNSRPIFKAEIGVNRSIDCSQCDIPSRDIDRLLKQEDSSQRTEQQPERSRTHYSR